VPRDLLVVPWQLLHMLERCNLHTHVYRPDVAPHCLHPPCTAAHVLDAIDHRFYQCPAVAAVWHWVGRVFACASGIADFTMTMDAAVLNDVDSLPPFPSALMSLWQVLRCAALHLISAHASKRDAGTQQFAAVDIAEEVIAIVRRAICVDAFLVRNDGVPMVADTGSLSMPCMSMAMFAAKWGVDGALFAASAGTIRVLFSLHHPFSWPA
jgi:hypothetical protein